MSAPPNPRRRAATLWFVTAGIWALDLVARLIAGHEWAALDAFLLAGSSALIAFMTLEIGRRERDVRALADVLSGKAWFEVRP